MCAFVFCCVCAFVCVCCMLLMLLHVWAACTEASARKTSPPHVTGEHTSLPDAKLNRQVMQPRAIQAVHGLEAAGRVWNSCDVGRTQSIIRCTAATVPGTRCPGSGIRAGRRCPGPCQGRPTVVGKGDVEGWRLRFEGGAR